MNLLEKKILFSHIQIIQMSHKITSTCFYYVIVCIVVGILIEIEGDVDIIKK